MATRHLSLGAAFAAVALPFVVNADAPSDAQSRELGTVTVIGRRPSSLPTQIPTTIEGIRGADVRVRINATDAEDALKYFPSLLVRKRYIGDYDHAVLASRASGTGNSARSLVYVDGILISNLLGNGASFTPRWGLVTPEEIERVDVLYGPFSAAYPGNSVGAVVDYVTRMPAELEMHASVSSFGEDFHIYRSEGRYAGWQASASVGDSQGPWSWWVNFNRLNSDAHPVSYANKLVANGVPDTAGTAVTGALAGRNPRNQDWLILGSTTATHTIQDHAKLKVGYDLSPRLRASYTLGIWGNEAQRSSETYLRDAAGNPVYSGTINVDGLRYTVTPADFAPTAGDLRHLMHGLSLKSEREGAWNFELAASVYDYDRDVVRSPTVALPAAAAGGSGRIADQGGTGWTSFALRAVRRPARDDGHVLDLGYQVDDFRLRTRVDGADDWLAGGPGARVSAFRGDTELASVYAQDTWAFAPRWRTTLGVRVERWSASNGAVSDAATTLAFAERSDTYVSPKFALARELTPQWSFAGFSGPRGSYADRRRALSRVDRDQRHRQQRSEPAARAIVDVGAFRRTPARARPVAAHGVLRGHRGRALLADERDRYAERHEHPERRRDRHARSRGGPRAAGLAGRPARRFVQHHLRPFAHRA